MSWNSWGVGLFAKEHRGGIHFTHHFAKYFLIEQDYNIYKTLFYSLKRHQTDLAAISITFKCYGNTNQEIFKVKVSANVASQ